MVIYRRSLMSLNKTSSFLYKAASLLRDVNAVQKGTIGKRVARKAAGKATSKMLGKLFK